MPVHRRRELEGASSGDGAVLAALEGETVVPMLELQDQEIDSARAYQIVHGELAFDGNARQNLATFCQTGIDPEARALMDESVDKNIVEKSEYPLTAEIESRCVRILADLWRSPNAGGSPGCSTTGSSEAAMLAGIAAKWRWRKRRQALGKPADRPNLVTGPVQVCWHRFCRFLDVELREIPMAADRALMTPEEMLARVDENTIAVVPTLGVTFTLKDEPVGEIAAALDDLQARTGLDIPIHVDAASGGFLAPFRTPDLEWDFRLPRVKSINASGHKFGLTPLGCGWVIWREPADLPDELVFNVNYLGGNMPTFGLNFSRPAGQVICQYYNFVRLGKEGYARIMQECVEVAAFLTEGLSRFGIFEIIHNGADAVPGVVWKLKEGIDPGFTLFELTEALRARGWMVPAYSLPPNLQEVAVQRVLCRHDFTTEMAALLVADMRQTIDELSAERAAVELTSEPPIQGAVQPSPMPARANNPPVTLP